LGLGVGLQNGLVDVEEGIGGVGDLFADRGRRRRRRRGSDGGRRGRGRRRGRRRRGRRLQGTIALLGGGGRRPGGLAPAQVVRAVLPHQRAVAVAPVVDRLLLGKRAGQRRGKCGRCEQHRHLVQFLHGSPLKESRSFLRYVQIGSGISGQTPLFTKVHKGLTT